MDNSNRGGKGLSTNKEKMRVLIENNIIDKIKSIFKENEMIVEKQLHEKQEAAKDDVNSQYVKGKIHEFVENNVFGKFAASLRNCRNLNPNMRTQYSKTFEDLQKLFVSIDKSFKENPIIKIKINNYLGEFTKQTDNLFGQMHDDFVRLDQAGCCGVGAALRTFQEKYREFEFKVLIWKTLPQLENQNVEYQVLKPLFDDKTFRAFLTQLINQTYPDQVGDTQIVEKEVIKYIEVPKIQIVEKTNTKEVPIIVEKIVERAVIKEVEVRVPEIREVIKEVIRNVSIPDRIREAHEMLFGLGRSQNLTEALNIYYEEAEVNSNVLAFNAIGQIFYEGKFFPKDLNKSFSYYEKSATMQDPEGLYRVGYFLLHGIIDGYQLSQGRLENRDKELEEAVMYLQKSSEQGHLEALTDLGEIFENGLQSSMHEGTMIIEPEHEQAEFYYTQGKKVRFPRAICLLGNFYLNHQEYKQKIKGDNARKAIKYFELSRDLGYQKAYYHLAFCYENGLGVNFPNREKAKSYYKEGALRGDTQCKINYMYYVMQDVSNSGRSEEYKFAYNYFRDILISDPQITETYYYLGHLYECGFGVAKDPQISMSFYNKGALLGNAACMNKLGDFYHSGYGVPKNQREALSWYMKAGEMKDPQALINLGTIFEEGYEGVAPDRLKAYNCYEEASKLNNPLAFFHLGLMYEAGRYVSKDMKTAVEMYKKSAAMGCPQARDLLTLKKIPMIYDDGINTAHINANFDDTDTLISAFDRQGLVGYKEDKPLITNAIVTQMGKKNNQSILQSKLDRQSQVDGRYQSILVFNAGQSAYPNGQGNGGAY